MNSSRLHYIYLIVFLSVILCLKGCVGADTIHLKDGRTLEGKVISSNEEQVSIAIGSLSFKFQRDDIISFQIDSEADAILKNADALTSGGLFKEALERYEQGYEQTGDVRFKKRIENVRKKTVEKQKEKERQRVLSKVNSHLANYYKLKDQCRIEEALDELELASRIDPTNIGILELMLCEYLDRAIYDSSAESSFLDTLHALTDLDPENSFAESLANLYNRRRYSVAADADRRKKLAVFIKERRRKQVKAMVDRGWSYVNQGDYKSAYSLAQRARKIIGSSKELRDLKAEILHIEEKYYAKLEEQRERRLWLEKVQSLRFYREVEKNPGKFVGTEIIWRGQVLEIKEEQNQTFIQAHFVDTEVHWEDDCFFVYYNGVCGGLIKEDLFTVRGKIVGEIPYESQAGFRLEGIIVEANQVVPSLLPTLSESYFFN